ncbi:MerR family transcriptional regulator [Agromyces sp. CCNWLW203]|uniref:MerR family transcriptional regulator n=1 Tax=Agromyces sp. CCNWLW203 TaxID=3112842 RepID=UPI002F964DE4
MATELDIADVAERTGLTPSALRFYERCGLIASGGRNGLRRTFAPEVVDRIVMIRCAQEAGFTLAQIGRFLVATPGDDELREWVRQRAQELEGEIARLIRMNDSLRHAATCTHSPLAECPDFKQRLLPGAARARTP